MATTVTLLWAQDRTGAIGRDNTVPWHVPEDLRRFRELTGTAPVVMGRKTWESLPDRFRPLPRRPNVVITRSASYVADGAEVRHSVADALDAIADAVTVIGGGEIYEITMPLATHLRVTEIDVLVDGADAFAPEIDPYTWELDTEGSWQTSTTGTRYRYLDYRRHDTAARDERRGA